jgi:hypothetical protein
MICMNKRREQAEREIACTISIWNIQHSYISIKHPSVTLDDRAQFILPSLFGTVGYEVHFLKDKVYKNRLLTLSYLSKVVYDLSDFDIL